jgi:tRNA(Arg) A34 adenosine deaminase TadA
MTSHCDTLNLTLPAWLAPFLKAWPLPVADDDAGMALAVALARENVERGTGGPFGAVVVDRAGAIVAAGVNGVEPMGQSWAHAEMVALAFAQGCLGSHDLSCHPGAPLTLYSSGEPCAMCLGAIPWAGVARVVVAAREADIEAVGFDEGDKPAAGLASLERHGIEVVPDVRRGEAREILAAYVDAGGGLYHP